MRQTDSNEYINLINNIKKNSGLVSFIAIMDKTITYSTVLLYGAFLMFHGYKYITSADAKILYLLLKSIFVPAISFIGLSVFRHFNHSKRPYEVYGFEPVIKKDKVEHSFPSRHVFSIFMIAMVFLQVSVPLAVILSVMGVGLAVLRVIEGVHFPRDVIAGALIGIACGLIGFSMLG